MKNKVAVKLNNEPNIILSRRHLILCYSISRRKNGLLCPRMVKVEPGQKALRHTVNYPRKEINLLNSAVL